MLVIYIALSMFPSLSQGFPQIDFSMVPVRSVYGANLTLLCIMNKDNPNIEGFKKARIEISKKVQDDWKPIAALKSGANSFIDVFDSTIKEVKGRSFKEMDTKTFLQVTWPIGLTASLLIGTYRCKGLFKSNFTKEMSMEINIQDYFQIIDNVQTASTGLDILKPTEPKVEWPINSKNWPGGMYGLLKPLSGCPNDTLGVWESGTKYIFSESSDSITTDNLVWRVTLETATNETTFGNLNSKSETSHLYRSFQSGGKGQMYVPLVYCVKMDIHASSPDLWPAGSYCINQKGRCAAGLTSGQVYIDEEDSLGNKGDVYGVVPDAYLSSTHHFCCRSDGSPDVPIELPNMSPFYLYRYGGKCQEVEDMTVEEEFVLIDSEDANNNDQRSGAFPDGTLNDVRFELCYYIPNNSYTIKDIHTKYQ